MIWKRSNITELTIFAASDTIVKIHLSTVGFDADDDLIDAQILSSIEDVETDLNFALHPCTETSYLPSFNSFYIDLPTYAGSLVISYYDVDNTLQTLSSGLYRVENDSIYPRVVFEDSGLPILYDRSDAVRVAVSAGYAAAVNVPKVIKQAILLRLADMYLQREDSLRKYPQASERLLGKIRKHNILVA